MSFFRTSDPQHRVQLRSHLTLRTESKKKKTLHEPGNKRRWISMCDDHAEEQFSFWQAEWLTCVHASCLTTVVCVCVCEWMGVCACGLLSLWWRNCGSKLNTRTFCPVLSDKHLLNESFNRSYFKIKIKTNLGLVTDRTFPWHVIGRRQLLKKKYSASEKVTHCVLIYQKCDGPPTN